jgi:hypothetical protein
MDTLALDCEKIPIVETWWVFCNHSKWCKRDGGFYNFMQLRQSFLFIILNIIMWKGSNTQILIRIWGCFFSLTLDTH